METSHCRLPALAAALVLVASPLVHADGGIDLTIDNNTSDTLQVTLVDLNVDPAQRVLTGEVINGFASLRVSVTPGAAGLGHVSWTAHTMGSGSERRCGQHDRPDLQGGTDVHVYANTECPTPIH